ncbi:ABC transporter permease [Fusibacter sp. JL298sf-3]
MYNLYILSKHQTKMLMRNAKMTIIGFLVPVMMFLVFSNLLSSMTVPDTGASIVNYLIPAYIPIIVINAVVVIFGQYYSLYKERGDLLKYKLIGIKPIVVASGIYFSTILFQILAITLLVAVGNLSKGLVVPIVNMPAILLALGLINVYQFSLTYLIAALVKKSTTYQSVALVVFYLQLFLGGLTFPPEMFPAFLKRLVYVFNPIVHGLEIMRGVWTEGAGITRFPLEAGVLVGVSFILIAAGSQVNKRRKEF